MTSALWACRHGSNAFVLGNRSTTICKRKFSLVTCGKGISNRCEIPFETRRHGRNVFVLGNRSTTICKRSFSLVTSGNGIEKKPEKEILTKPQQTMVYLNDVGLVRGERPASQIFYSSVLGGAYLCWGASMFILLGGGSPELAASNPGAHKVLSALIFPIGLSSIVVSGSDLLTSNMCYATLPFVSGDPRRTKEQKLENLVRLWSVSTAGNVIGCGAFALATAGLFSGSSMGAFAAGIATKKVMTPAVSVFFKAIGANWLVNLGVFLASNADSAPGKAAMLWLPVTAFVALGLEHCVASMYLIPLGALCGADTVTLTNTLGNLLPAIAGNAVGAGFCVSFLQWKALMHPNFQFTER